MSTTEDDLKSGIEALRSGAAHRARELFQKTVERRSDDPTGWLCLALACRALADDASTLAAIDQLLKIQPRNVRGLLLKGDHFAKSGDRRSAMTFYQAALKSASTEGHVPSELEVDLRRARDACAAYAAHYQTYLLEALAARGFNAETASGRFARSVDIALGKRRVFYQQPRFYYFPELPQIQFYDQAVFPWLADVEAAADDIRAELLRILEDEAAFEPYLQVDPRRPQKSQAGLLNNPKWSAFFLCKDGKVVEDNAARCPQTMRALQAVPLPHVPNRSPTILFSLLKGGARIPPHNGFVNTRLICHLPLLVPDGCEFRVGNEVRPWREGKAWLFDDTIEHEAWNNSDQTRVILLFDVWRPELTLEERDLVCALFEAINTYDGANVDWSV